MKQEEQNLNIQLRPFTDDDMALFVDWLHSAHIQQWYSPVEAWIEEVRKRADEFSWIRHYIICADDVPIGFCQYYPYWKSGEDWNGRIPVEDTYSVDYLVGDVSYLRKGVASRALRLLSSIIFECTGAKRIIAQPDRDNAASRNTLRSAGFSYDEANDLYILEHRQNT
jgi:RimJ/RimL family protein N-acetyltransferase